MSCANGCGCGCGCGKSKSSSKRCACGCNTKGCDCRKKSCHDDRLGCDVVPTTTVDLANANKILTSDQLGSGVVRLASTPNLTASRNVTLPSGSYSLVLIGDATLGGSSAVVGVGSGGATVNVAAGQTLFVNVAAGGVFLG